jgi:TPR repeat protein
MRFVTSSIIAILLSASSALAEAYEDGVAAYTREDYTTALRLFQPLAEQGDPRAQFNLGVIYELGQCVPQDNSEAVKWYRKAAEQGLANAQYKLGLMYRAAGASRKTTPKL